MATNYFENMTNIGQMLQVANYNTNGWFWAVMNLLIFVVALVSLLGFGFETAVVTASFIALVIGIFLAYMDLILWKYVLFYVGIILFMIIYIAYNRKSY